MAKKNKPDPNATRLGSDEPAKTQVANSSDATRFVETSESRGVDFQPGVLIKNRYELIKEIGRGGMGSVWQARDTQFKRLGDRIALKFMLSQWVANPEALSRFKSEAMVSLELNQQNIINVRDIDQDQGIYFLVMEYLEGQDLHEILIDKGRLELDEVERIFVDVCNALDYAHSSMYKLIHRDLKPQNVFVCDDGTTKVMDFGIAKILDKETMDQISSLTSSGQSLGTLEYMAPEQRKGLDTVDARADIYSLGLILYEMLTGELPVGVFEKPSEVTDGKVPKAVDAVIDQCIAQRVGKRYSSVKELKDAFLRAVGKIKSDEGSFNVENLYLQACERVYLDGKVDPGERAMLNELKGVYNITDEKAEKIEKKVREKYPDIVEQDTTAAPAPAQQSGALQKLLDKLDEIDRGKGFGLMDSYMGLFGQEGPGKVKAKVSAIQRAVIPTEKYELIDFVTYCVEISVGSKKHFSLFSPNFFSNLQNEKKIKGAWQFKARQTISKLEMIAGDDQTILVQLSDLKERSGYSESGKSKSTAAMLALFLGMFGAHKFYMGERKSGWYRLLFCWTYIPIILGFIDGFRLIIMSEKDFNDLLEKRQ